MANIATRFSDEAAICEDCQSQEFDFDGNGIIRDPGKFEGETLATYHAYHASLDGGCSDEFGDSSESNWCGLIGNMLLWESNMGFVSSEIFATDEDAQAAFDKAAAEYQEDEAAAE